MQKQDGHRKYYFNNSIFDIIDSKEKAYWLGFLYADGYILTQRGGFGIALKESDVGHLQKFVHFLSVNTEDCIKYNNSTNSCKVQLCDIHLWERLVELGFTPNKSYDKTTTVFDNMPADLKKFFLLGFWDGDGYVSISNEKKNLTGCVSNNVALIQSFIIFINRHFGKDWTHLIMSDNYPRIRICTNKAKQFLDWLYYDTDSSIQLERKYNTYKNFKEPSNKSIYHNIKKLPSGNYFVRKQFHNEKITIGTFSTVKEAIEAYNKVAKEKGFSMQEYKGELI